MPYQVQVGAQVVEFPDSVSQNEAQRILADQFPATGEDIAGAMQDPAFRPTQQDYLKYEEYTKNKQTDWINTAAQAADAAVGMITGAAVEGVKGAALNPANYLEGFAQGTRQLYGLVAQSQDPSSPLFKFKDLVAGTGTPESRYQQFLEARDFANTTARLERGEEGLAVPPEYTNPEYVQGVSMILDPTLFVPGVGEVLGTGKLATKAVGRGAKLAGEAIAGAARPLERITGAAERMTAEALGMTPEGLRSTAATAGLAGALGIAPEAATLAAIPAGIRTTREAGEALARAGENLMTQPSRIGPLEAIGAAPGANMRQRLLGVVGQYGGDAALDAALRATAGGLEGAAVGAGLGYLSGGEEGAAAGLGSGAVQGAAGALGGRAYQKLTGQAAKEARAGDLGRFIDAQQDPTTKALFERVRDTHGVDTASALMDVSDLVKGQFGDIDIRYLSDADFVDQYKGRARGVQVEIGDRPTIVINADILGKGKGDSPLYTLGHELFHALEKSQQLSGGATEIKNALVGRWIQEGDVIRKLADGAFSDAEIEARFNEYRDKLAAGNKQRADELAQFDTINKKADYIASELAAEHFAALIAGQKPDAMLKGFTGLSRQLLDAALTQNASRAIANAAASIERTFGVKPTDSVLFPDLKQASPQLNAMLRDLLRARKRLDEKIILDSEKGGRVLKPEDVSNPLAAKELVDLGLAEQMPDGSVRNLSTDEIRAREEKDLTSLRAITDKLPGARLVDGEISGRFSPEQLSAIEQSQTISSRMKDKIRAVNLAIENGNSLFVTYYAALRRVRNRLTGKESPKYSSGIKVSEREFVPYSFQITKADNPLVRAIDITKVRNELTKLLKKDGSIGGLWANTDGFMADLAKYFTNLDQKEGALRSAEIFGVDKAKFLGDFINSSEKSGGKFIRSFRLDRVGSMAPMDFKAKFSEEAYQLSKQRWMPSEKIGDKSVTNSDEGYRIISGAKHKLYGPDGKLLGIFDTQTQAERKADATQARLQPKDRQQQYPARDEVRQTAEAGRGDSALGRSQGREEGRQELGAVRQAGDVGARFMPDQQGFYSKLEEVVNAKIPKMASPQQVLASVDPAKGSGVKPEELKWTGFAQAVERIAKENGGKVPKEKLIEHLKNEGRVRFEEVTSGIQGKSITQEEVDRLERRAQRTQSNSDWRAYEDAVLRFESQELGTEAQYSKYQLPGGENYREVVLTSETAAPYTSSHFRDIPFYVAHMRVNERTAEVGKPGLFIEEIQSDRHQQAREQGYKEDKGTDWSKVPVYSYKELVAKGEFPNQLHIIQKSNGYYLVSPDGTMLGQSLSIDKLKSEYDSKAVGVSDAPFRKDWSLQMFKRALRDAVASGKEWIGWTTGETQAERYDLSKQIKTLSVEPLKDGTGKFAVYANGDLMRHASRDTLSDVVGKEMAQKALSDIDAGKAASYSGLDLKIGGEGMKGFYDKILPAEVQKYVKQWGGEVRRSNFSIKEAPIWRVDITPEMRKSVETVGQPRFMPSDTDYLSAVQKGDTKTAQRMVDEAAKAAGYTVGPVFHGTQTRTKFTEFFPRSHFGTEAQAQKVATNRGRLYRVFLKLNNPAETSDMGFKAKWTAESKRLKAKGHDGIVYRNIWESPNFAKPDLSYVVFDPSQIKSAEPITRDDAGNVIPLSKRFQASSEDIRYMPATSQRKVGRNIDFANPPTAEKAVDALSSEKKPLWRKHDDLPEGSPVGVRIDIPAFLNRGTYVQTIHEPATPGNVGDRIGYDTSVRLSGPVRFFVKEGSEESKLGAVAIKEGRAAKHPIATVEGKLIKDRSIPSDIETWTPVGMDPKKHSYFYDKRTDKPVTGGSESFSVGNTVFVKDPVYGKPEDFRYMPQPDSSMPGAYSFPGGYRAIPGKTKGGLRLYGPAGSLIGIAASLDEAQRILRRKSK
ncbi:MAG: hypothetical protein KGR21_09265 [Proteobacteria bacterium]|nr:hypothetical protein [Pseudomonadota bacterium]